MCNLIRYKEEMQKVYGEFGEINDIRISPKVRFKVAPSEPAPVLTVQNDVPRIGMMNFGLATGKGRQLMARGETVAELPLFREAFKKRRCLILAHGFYDSEDMGKYRQPWHIHLKGDGLMGFAGLWEERPEAENFTIVSAPANVVVARVIDRMPVILPKELWRSWLNPETDAASLQAILTPFDADKMEAYPVTRKVNQKGFDGPECVVPFTPEQGDLGLF
jgi:putative SOS response-associated peptidase YedK